MVGPLESSLQARRVDRLSAEPAVHEIYVVVDRRREAGRGHDESESRLTGRGALRGRCVTPFFFP